MSCEMSEENLSKRLDADPRKLSKMLRRLNGEQWKILGISTGICKNPQPALEYITLRTQAYVSRFVPFMRTIHLSRSLTGGICDPRLHFIRS